MRTILLPILLLCGVLLSAQPGTLDLTFGNSDASFGMGLGADGSVSTIAVQTDGKIICADVVTYNGVRTGSVIRVDTNGLQDPDFVVSPLFQDVRKVVVQPDGKVLIGGDFVLCIARLNANGSWDRTFDGGMGANGRVTSIVLQADGRILIAGTFIMYNGIARNRVARLNADGSLDGTFDTGSGADGVVNAAVLQPDGKLLIAGDFSSFDGTQRNRLARLNSDGTLDRTFDPASGPNGRVEQLLLQADGRILLAGEFTQYNGVGAALVARSHPQGELDESFGSDVGFAGGGNYSVLAMAAMPDGSLMLAGSFRDYDGVPNRGRVQLYPDGGLLAGFDPYRVWSNIILVIHALPDGRTLLGGNWFAGPIAGTRRGLARLRADGELDLAFNTAAGANGTVTKLALQPDGKVLAIGDFTAYGEHRSASMVRILPDGAADTTFSAGTGVDSTIHSCITLPNGQLIIVGNFTQYNGVARRHIARLHADGSLDTTFNAGYGGEGPRHTPAIFDVVRLPDDKLLAVGRFTRFAEQDVAYIVRLHPDGAVDTDHRMASPVNGTVHAVALLSDGKVLIGGEFGGGEEGGGSPRIGRLNADGTWDNDFQIEAGPDRAVRAILVQPDGKILIGGAFTRVSGVACYGLARLDANGSLDRGFGTGIGMGVATFHAMALQADGKVLVCGSFISYDGAFRNYLARLHSAGYIDLDFGQGAGAERQVHALTVQPDGKILIGGEFRSYDGISRNGVARLLGGDGVGMERLTSGADVLHAYPNPTSGRMVLRTDHGGAMELRVVDTHGRTLLREHRLVQAGQEVEADLAQLVPGVYIVGLHAVDGRAFTARLVKQ